MRSGSLTAAPSISAARASVSVGRSTTSDDDIDASFTLNHLVAFQPQLRIGRAFAGLELVFPAVPGTDDVRIVIIVSLGHERLVRCIDVDDLAPDDALAGRATLVQAMVAVGVESAVVAIDPDLDPVLADNADVAVLHFDVL